MHHRVVCETLIAARPLCFVHRPILITLRRLCHIGCWIGTIIGHAISCVDYFLFLYIFETLQLHSLVSSFLQKLSSVKFISKSLYIWRLLIRYYTKFDLIISHSVFCKYSLKRFLKALAVCPM